MKTREPHHTNNLLSLGAPASRRLKTPTDRLSPIIADSVLSFRPADRSASFSCSPQIKPARRRRSQGSVSWSFRSLQRSTLRRAFTLIELLIVVAIIAIITGGSMAILTGPMFERVRAEDQEAFETGAGVFFATLVHDAHRAASLESDSSGTLTLALAPPTTGTVVYSVNSRGTLTRALADKPGAKLVTAVQALTAEKLTTAPLWTITLSANLRGYDGKPTTVTRRMDILAGASAWSGGAS